MTRFTFDHLDDHPLLQGTRSLRARDRLTTALLVARIGEIDARRLAERMGYASIMAWCIAELRLSEDEAGRRIRAARFGRSFPALFEALADGRLHLTAVNLIGPHLSKATADDWIAAATHRTRAEIQALIAIRRPRPDGPDGMVELAGSVLEQVRDRVLPTSPQRHLFQCAIGETLRAMLEEARGLMSHQNPGGKYEAILIEALELLLPALKKQKFATSGAGERRIPSDVKAKVWERDGGRCAYVAADGRRCGSGWQVEFDHVEPVARGGEATVENVRCLCRAHNQLEAERRFGAGFMEEKRRRAADVRKSGRIEMKSATRAGAAGSATESANATRAGAGRSTESRDGTRAGAGSLGSESSNGTRGGAGSPVPISLRECSAATSAA